MKFRPRSAVHEMFHNIAPRYDVANDVLSLGLHRHWKKKALDLCSTNKARTIIDLCTGTGDLFRDLLSRATKETQIIGVDFVEDMLRRAEEKTAPLIRERPAQASFIQADAMRLPFAAESAGLVTIAFGIRNVPDTIGCLKEIRRVLKPGGELMVLEFGQPSIPGWASIYRLYSRYVIPLLGQYITGNRAAYEYLPRTSSEYPSGRRFLELLRSAGFEERRCRALAGGVAFMYLAARPAAA